MTLFHRNIKVYQVRYSVLFVALISVFRALVILLLAEYHVSCEMHVQRANHHAFILFSKMVLRWQTDDNGSSSGMVVHMWKIIIHSEITSITSNNSLAL